MRARLNLGRQVATVVVEDTMIRQVRRDTSANWRRQVIEVYRLDTGELIEVRPMTASERHRHRVVLDMALGNG